MKIFIGYEDRLDSLYRVAKQSILRRAPHAEIIPLKKKELEEQNKYWIRDELASTEFTYTRFLVPHLMDYDGWALFIDCDFLFLDDVKKLFALCNDKYAVMCAKHDYRPTNKTKMDNKPQNNYPRKNWSSMVLWNCGHPSNKVLTTKMVNESEAQYLHRFSWLKDEEIGNVSHEWNWLVGWYKEPKDGKPKALHYTEGGPWFKDCYDTEYARVWLDQFHLLPSPDQ